MQFLQTEHLVKGYNGRPVVDGVDIRVSRGEIVGELEWTMARAEEHLGAERAARYMRKFYPWYLERLGITGPEADRFQRLETLGEVRGLLERSLAAALAA